MKQYKQNKTDCVRLKQQDWIIFENTRYVLPPFCNFKAHERNMHQRHLTAGITELIARTSLVTPKGVSTFGNHTHRVFTTQSIYAVHIPR